MNVTWRVLALLSLVCYAESRCSPTSYYKNCWIRRFPGIYIDVEESQRRGAHLLKFYQEDTALKCSRTCCLTRNFSCNLAIFHYDATQENMNCFHLHCPSLESCILSHRGNVVLYNITKGVDPDLLVFGKYFNPDVRVLPHHYSHSNASNPLPPDKRHFIHPPAPPPAPVLQPLTTEPSRKHITTTRAEPSNMATTAESSTMATRTGPSTMETRTDSPSMATSLPSTTHQSVQTPFFTTPAPKFDAYEPSTFHSSVPKPNTDTAKHLSTPSTPLLSDMKSAVPTQAPTNSAVSSDALANIESSSKQKANDTKWSLGRNHSMVSEDGHAAGGGGGGGGGDVPWGDLGPGWHVATHTVLVAVAICVTLLLGCCCSVVLVFSWRGHKKRMGRYRTSWRGKKGSMRLIKYVLVKENS